MLRFLPVNSYREDIDHLIDVLEDVLGISSLKIKGMQLVGKW